MMTAAESAVMTIELHCDELALRVFERLFQHGVILEAELGVSIRDVLCRQMGLSEDYVDNRINTVFYNSMPVDDIDEAIVADGAFLALSASMPGCAGALLRKGGFFSTMRSTISYSDDGNRQDQGKGEITVRLYNITAREVGPHMLERGVIVRCEQLKQFFTQRAERFWEGCSRIKINGADAEVAALRSQAWPDEDVRAHLQAHRVQ